MHEKNICHATTTESTILNSVTHLRLFVFEIRELRPTLVRYPLSGGVVRHRRVQGGDILRDLRLVLKHLVATEAIL